MTRTSFRVLAYHRVMYHQDAGPPNPTVLSATPEVFTQHVRYLAAHYDVVSLDDALAAQRGDRDLPRRAVMLTFDDATRDFATHAWPVLRRHGVPATVFVPTAFPGDSHRSFWWERVYDALQTATTPAVTVDGLGSLRLRSAEDRRFALLAIQRHMKTLPDREATARVEALCHELGVTTTPASSVLDWDELRVLARDGVTFAPHTMNHPALTRIPPDQVRAEIRGSIGDLRRELGTVPAAFCYPYGDHDDVVVALARQEGIEMAFTCQRGRARLPAEDPLRIPRLSITPRTSARVLALRLSAVGGALDRWRSRSPSATKSRAGVRVPPAGRGPIAYIMSRFPKLSETFVLNEMVAMESMGIAVEAFPLLREREAVQHPEAARWVRRAHYEPFLSTAILRANWHHLRRDPRRYLGVWAEVLRGTWRSWNFFIGALGILPKSVKFACEMEKLGVSHVHAHFATHPALAALIVHRLTGIPFSFTAHGSDLHVDRTMLDVKVASSAFTVAISRFNRDVIIGECGAAAADKIHVVHCGVDTSMFDPVEGWREHGTFTVVCVASFEEVKGHRFLIQACRILRDRGIDLTCHLVGGGPLKQEMEALIARLDLGTTVRIHGGCPRPQVIDLLRDADVFALASYPTSDGKKEGIPVALMEAMACGLPIVASGISGIPELVTDGETGLLVPPANPERLALALERMAQDPGLRCRMGRAGRQRVVHNFSLQANAAALARLMTGRRAEQQPATARPRPLAHA